MTGHGGDYPVRAQRERRAAHWMRKHGWNLRHGTARNRLYDLTSDRHRWWDWGHRLMVLTGTDVGGNWSEPSPPTWWYRRDGTRRMWRTGYPRPTFQVVTDYAELRRLTAGANEDEMYEWQAIGTNGDGDLHLGHRYWGGTFYDLDKREVPLLRRYLRRWWFLDWFGARSWLYHQGLHAAVHAKKPGTCQAVPPRDSSGYDHWYCQRPRRHDGLHRFNSYEWGHVVGGEPIGVVMVAPSDSGATRGQP